MDWMKRGDRMKDEIMELKNGFDTAFINQYSVSSLAYRPEFVTNDHLLGKKVLSAIEYELRNCDEFYISVAFITMGGIVPLLQTFKELEEKNIRGYIMTTDYLTFSDPNALKKLSELKNIEIKMYCVGNEHPGFHTKGYIFRQKNIYKILVGSSNLTQSALTKNKEWNIKIVATKDGEYTNDILDEFSKLWKQSKEIGEWIDTYSALYLEHKKVIRATKVATIEQLKLRPNMMQVTFSHKLKKLFDEGAKKAILISSTGTGKTYAAAFALRNMNPEKVLFLVHREQIARQAISSFKNVFGSGKSFGLLSGSSKDTEEDFLFSTMSMMAKQEIRQQFSVDEFDIIVIDEAHRTGAKSYQDIMNYFEPKLWLGMTASPERTDDFDVFNAYDHNIAYEIRLQQAMEEDLLCPFHYYGIQDIELEGMIIDENTEKVNFNLLTSDERVNHIISQAEYFGHCGERVKGLVFCSSKKEAKELSKRFNQHGYVTMELTGEHSQEEREAAVERLVSDTRVDKLDYIFTVDIFNEGIDIPEINQIIMLRPTQSPIVFVQQLGRGLRKAEGKEFVVIIDFIGNYKNNFMIPIALSGDRSYNKDTLRKYVVEGNRVIPGSSTIHFDEVTRKRIYESIDVSNFNDVRIIKESYKQLKFKLGRIPSLIDFEEHGEIDAIRIFENKSLGTYYKFLTKYEKDYTIRISKQAEKYLEYISKKFASGKRVHELQMLKRIITYKQGLLKILGQDLQENYGILMNEATRKNIINVFTNEFATGSGKSTYEDCIFIEQEEDDYKINSLLNKELQDVNFLNMVIELVEFGFYKNQTYYNNPYLNTSFQLYKKYTYEDVCRLLEWEKAEVALNIGGYKYDSKTKTYPVFINYHKEDYIQDTVKYEDRFINPSTLIAISKSGRTVLSEDVKTALNADSLGVQMELFVRKNKDDKTSKEFYYLGKIKATGNVHEVKMSNTNKAAVEIEYKLVTPVQEDIYEYIIN